MKRILLTVASLIAFGAMTYAQCDKKFSLSSSKTEYLNEKMELQRSVDEAVVITIDKTTITIDIDNADEKRMTGTVTPVSCQWKTPFGDGKMVLKADIKDQRGDTKSTTITIEGKDGKVTFLLELNDEKDKKIRLAADKFAEQK